MNRNFSRRIVFLSTVITVLSVFLLADPSIASGPSGDSPEKTQNLVPNDSPPVEAIPLLRETIHRIEGLGSLAAEIKLTCYPFGETYTGTGKYEELSARFAGNPRNSRNGLLDPVRFRLSLELPPPRAELRRQGAEINKLETVCDLNSLWTFTSIEGEQRLTEINLDELSGYLSQLTPEEKTRLTLAGVELPSGLGAFPALGGISGTLKSLMNWYDFDPIPQAGTFNNGTFSVWKISGRMKPARYENLKKRLADPSGRVPPELVAELPDSVEIHLGERKPFPYRIHYFAKPDDRNKRYPLLTIDFTAVFEDKPGIRPENFLYAPKINSDRRVTRAYLQQLIPDIEL